MNLGSSFKIRNPCSKLHLKGEGIRFDLWLDLITVPSSRPMIKHNLKLENMAAVLWYMQSFIIRNGTRLQVIFRLILLVILFHCIIKSILILGTGFWHSVWLWNWENSPTIRLCLHYQDVYHNNLATSQIILIGAPFKKTWWYIPKCNLWVWETDIWKYVYYGKRIDYGSQLNMHACPIQS